MKTEERVVKKKAYDKARYVAHREEMLAHGNAYNVDHREERKVYNNAYYVAHREEKKAYRTSPEGRAAKFLLNNPDCTSSIEEIMAFYAASIDVTTGLPGKIGRGAKDLVLDHIHNGPAVGLVPGWLNRVFTKYLDIDLVLKHREQRRKADATMEEKNDNRGEK